MNKRIAISVALIGIGLVFSGCKQTPTPTETMQTVSPTTTPAGQTVPTGTTSDDDSRSDVNSLENDLNTMKLEEETFVE